MISGRPNRIFGVAKNPSSASSPSSGPANTTRDSKDVRAPAGSHHPRRARASRPGPGSSRPSPASPSRRCEVRVGYGALQDSEITLTIALAAPGS